MTDACATWAAAHALILFTALPLLTAAVVYGLAQGYLALPVSGRRRLYVGLTAAAFGLFLVLALAVERPGRLVAFDAALAQALSLSLDGTLLQWLSWFTYLGDRNFLTFVAVCMVLFLLCRREWRLAVFGAVATAGGGLLNGLFKNGFARARPTYDHDYVSVAGWSFPSGHASAAMAVYGTACYVWWRLAPSAWRLPGVAVAAALIAAIGLSRILLQVHFASDVLAGFAVSVGWLALCVAWARQFSDGAREK